MIKPKHTPLNYSTVSPYLMVDNVEIEIDFISKIFNGVINEKISITGEIQHAEIAIGEVTIMIGKSKEDWPSLKSMIYIFVPDIQSIFKNANKEGFDEIMKPVKRDYGFVEGAISDPHGNQWWVAQA